MQTYLGHFDVPNELTRDEAILWFIGTYGGIDGIAP